MSQHSLKLVVELYDYWHAGTGRSDGVGLDAVVDRDEAQLPMIDGSHLRGLLRHAARQVEEYRQRTQQVPPEKLTAPVTNALFGLAADDASPPTDQVDSRFNTTPGKLRVGLARVPASWHRILAHPNYRDRLFRPLFSTAIDEATGTVQARTLRSIEVCVPLRLEAEIESTEPLSKIERETLDMAAGLVQAVGKHRTRGLGRARLTLE